MIRVDPINVCMRRMRVIQRRSYSVPGPNALWHIDGHHSLIRWRIVVHGGIDGFSRLITYLHYSTNNQADTVFTLFQEAIAKYGVPSRVRSDRGGENIDVAKFMIENRGLNRGSRSQERVYTIKGLRGCGEMYFLMCYNYTILSFIFLKTMDCWIVN